MHRTPDRHLDLLRDQEWFIATFRRIVADLCLSAGFSYITDDYFLARAHKNWMKRCEANAYRIKPSERNFHFRLVGWLCYHLVTDDFDLAMPELRKVKGEPKDILLNFSKIFLSISVCYDILMNIEVDIGRRDPADRTSPSLDTLYSACSNITDDPRQAVHFMQILAGDYEEPTSFL